MLNDLKKKKKFLPNLLINAEFRKNIIAEKFQMPTNVGLKDIFWAKMIYLISSLKGY